MEAFLLVCLLVQVHCVESGMIRCAQPDARILLRDLNKALASNEVRPVISLNSPTNVTTYFTLYGILGVDEKAQILTTFIWHTLEWDIEYVSWDPVQCGASRISLPREKLWVPDILINEFMDADRSPNAPFIYLTQEGHVIDSRPVRVVSSCNLDIYTFPFDVQNCSLSFNSYSLLAGDVQLTLGMSAEETLRRSKEVLTTVGEWELIDITAEDILEEITHDFFDEVVYHIVLRRRATLYVVNLLVPSCFLITVDLFSFLLPPQSVDRSSFKMTLILGYTVFLLIMNDLLPITGNRIPLINVFFSICLALMVGSLLETVLITNILCNSSQYPAVPRWIRVIFLEYLARLVCLYRKPSDCVTVILNTAVQVENMETKSSPDGCAEPQLDGQVLGQLKQLGQDVLAIRQQVDKHLTANHTAEDWILIGNIIDRLLFCSYILFIIISFISITTIWIQWYSL
ncbi:5-hydroxytryptamine receptor 3A-like [Conger conger]|nr:5-hydroxytryptamine receptor 3A-like [Conger conger]